MNNYFFKRAKGISTINIHGKKYYDFRSNGNILGFSNKRITKEVKNAISSTWNIKGNSIYHKRFEDFIGKLFGKDYTIGYALSLKNFFTLVLSYFNNKNTSYSCNSTLMHRWLKDNVPNYAPLSESVNWQIADMAWNFLFETDILGHTPITNNNDFILNYYWYPDIKITTFDKSIIILPQLYSGGFEFVCILINKKNKDLASCLESTANIPSLYLLASMKNYHEIKRLKNTGVQAVKLMSRKIIQKGRIFIIEDYADHNTIEEFDDKNILLSRTLPYYNYLPLVMEESQRKYFLKTISSMC